MAIIETNISSQDGRITLDTLVVASARWIPSSEGRETLLRLTLFFFLFFLRLIVPLHFQLCGPVSFGRLSLAGRRQTPGGSTGAGSHRLPLSFRFKSALLPGEQTAVAQLDSSACRTPTPTNPCCVRFSLRHLHSSSNVKAAFLSYQVFLGPMQSRRRRAPHFIP